MWISKEHVYKPVFTDFKVRLSLLSVYLSPLTSLLSLFTRSISKMDFYYNLSKLLWFVNFSLSKINMPRVSWRWRNILMCVFL